MDWAFAAKEDSHVPVGADLSGVAGQPDTMEEVLVRDRVPGKDITDAMFGKVGAFINPEVGKGVSLEIANVTIVAQICESHLRPFGELPKKSAVARPSAKVGIYGPATVNNLRHLGEGAPNQESSKITVLALLNRITDQQIGFPST